MTAARVALLQAEELQHVLRPERVHPLLHSDLRNALGEKELGQTPVKGPMFETGVPESLKVGDSVVTAGGVHGKVAGIQEDTVMVEIATGVKVKFNRSSKGLASVFS